MIIPSIIGITSIIVFNVFFNATIKDSVLEEARENSKEQMNRAVEMFMVSTNKFHDQFNKVCGDSSKKAVVDKWNETIAAVDQAVAIQNSIRAKNS